jgi:hypothetical protein
LIFAAVTAFLLRSRVPTLFFPSLIAAGGEAGERGVLERFADLEGGPEGDPQLLLAVREADVPSLSRRQRIVLGLSGGVAVLEGLDADGDPPGAVLLGRGEALLLALLAPEGIEGGKLLAVLVAQGDRGARGGRGERHGEQGEERQGEGGALHLSTPASA